MAATKTTGQQKAKTAATPKPSRAKNSSQPIEVAVEPDHLRVTIRLSKHSDPLLFNEIASVAAFHRTHRLVRLAATGLLAEGMVNSKPVLEHLERFSKVDAEFLTEMIQQKKQKQARKASKKMAKQTGEQQ